MKTSHRCWQAIAAIALILPAFVPTRQATNANAAPQKFELVDSQPSWQQEVTETPAALRLVFSAPVDPQRSSALIVGRTGVPTDVGPFSADPTSAQAIWTAFPRLPDDRYAVMYYVTGIDGRTVRGRFSFTLAVNGPVTGPVAGWPPIRITIEATIWQRWITYKMWVWNISLRPTQSVTVRGIVPANTWLVASGIGNEDTYPGKWDSDSVGWTLLDPVPPSTYNTWGTIAGPFGPFVYVVDTEKSKPGDVILAHASAEWILPPESESSSYWDDEWWDGQQGGIASSSSIRIVVDPDGTRRPQR